METKLEVVSIKANTPLLGGQELYWLFSRSQLEFILQDVKVYHLPPLPATAQYQDVMLPVINLENHFGLPEVGHGRSVKYLVVRAVTINKALVKVIIQTPNAVKIQQPQSGSVDAKLLALPRNSTDLLGVYALSDGSLGIVPDIAGIFGALKLRGGQSL